ncbi:MAG: regulatory protein RecX [Clostridia bacterium]|nr:regulatory protein RecX [Clostridia bacterium]
MTDGILLSRVSPRGDKGTEFVFLPDGGGEFSLLLSDEFYLDWYSRAGDIITDDEYLFLEGEAEYYSAFGVAVRLLDFGEMTAASLVRKLTQRGITRETAIRVSEKFTEMSLIDEERFAKRAVKYYLEKKCLGRSRILSELYKKGFGREYINAAMEEISDEDVILACTKQLEKKFGGTLPKDPAERRRAVAAMTRLGFSPSEVSRAEKENY